MIALSEFNRRGFQPADRFAESAPALSRASDGTPIFFRLAMDHARKGCVLHRGSKGSGDIGDGAEQNERIVPGWDEAAATPEY